jgi:hypothetical protein
MPPHVQRPGAAPSAISILPTPAVCWRRAGPRMGRRATLCLPPPRMSHRNRSRWTHRNAAVALRRTARRVTKTHALGTGCAGFPLFGTQFPRRRLAAICYCDAATPADSPWGARQQATPHPARHPPGSFRHRPNSTTSSGIPSTRHWALRMPSMEKPAFSNARRLPIFDA